MTLEVASCKICLSGIGFNLRGAKMKMTVRVLCLVALVAVGHPDLLVATAFVRLCSFADLRLGPAFRARSADSPACQILLRGGNHAEQLDAAVFSQGLDRHLGAVLEGRVVCCDAGGGNCVFR